MREYSLKLYQERFQLDIRRNLFTGSVIGHCNGLHKEVVESLELPSSEVFRRRLGTHCHDLVYKVVPEVLRGLLQPN